MYRQFNIQQFYVLPTQCIYVFCVYMRTNSDISLYSINWLVFITETVSVYFAVRTESSSHIHVTFLLIRLSRLFKFTCKYSVNH
jgi:hypothetical protein